MARIADGILKDWKDGDTITSDDYERALEIIRVANNDNHDRVVNTYTKAEVNAISSLQNTAVVDGGSFLDNPSLKVIIVDGGTF